MSKKLTIRFDKLVDLSHRLDFFNTMSDVQRIKVLKSLNGDLIMFEDEEQIIQEGENETDLYIILSGEVVVEKGDDEFSAVGNVKGGDFFGEISFIMGTKRIASVFARKETIVLRLSQKKFTELDAEIQVLIKDKIIRKLIFRLDEMNRQVLLLRNLNFDF